MKRIIITLVALFTISIQYGQASLFDKFEEMDDVTSITVAKDAFKMLAKYKGNTAEGKEYMDMVKGLTSLRVFTTENSDIAQQMQSTIKSYLKSSQLTELMRVKDKGANVRIYIRKGKDEDHVSELLMSVNEKRNAVILSLTGDIDLNKISKIIDPHIPNSKKYLKKK